MLAIMTQIQEEFIRFKVAKKSISTLFIGGGTPSCIAPSAYAKFFDFVLPYMKEGAEITSEANPNSADKSWLEGMLALGVNRISFGVQSFDAEKLHFLNRAHTATQAKEAIMMAKELGFSHISLDLIYGTALDTKALLEKDITSTFSLPIDHLSAYALTLEENTPFFKKPELAVDDESLAFWLVERIKEKFPQYEISNFGTNPSLHNLGYWQYKNYIGVGSGAIGFLNDRRFYTQHDVQAYIQNPLDIKHEALSEEDIKSEKILLGLRSKVGFAQSILTKNELENAQYLVEAKKLRHHDKHFYNDNFFLADELTLFILS